MNKVNENVNINTQENSNNEIEIFILYGSQTGTSKFASEELERQLIKYDFRVTVSCLDEFNYLNLAKFCIKNKYFVFITATTGNST